MFYYLKDGNPEIDAMMASVCDLGGQGTTCVTDARWRFRDYDATPERAAQSLKHAKHQPRSKNTRWLKTRLYSAQYNWFRNRFESNPDAVAVAWNGLTGTRRAFMSAAKDSGTPHLYMERAPLPGRVTLDHVGVNQVNGLPREIGFYRDWADSVADGHGDGWRALKAKLTARKAEKRGDVGQTAADAALAEQPFVFCPLQVPDDTQLKMFGGWVKNINRFIDLLELAAEALPDGWHLRFKEHPSSKISLTEALEQARRAQPGKIVIDNSTDTFAQVAASRAVITLNSSVGLQAFWYDKPVLVLGQAFFRMPELVTPVNSMSALFHTFQNINDVSFDPTARTVFMNYLDRVYYPVVDGTGKDARVLPELVRPKIEAALATRT